MFRALDDLIKPHGNGAQDDDRSNDHVELEEKMSGNDTYVGRGVPGTTFKIINQDSEIGNCIFESFFCFFILSETL